MNLPNLLTALRLALTPVIVYLIVRHDLRSAVLVTFIAGISDAFDGYLARRLQVTSRLGAYLDPIADKVMLVAVYLALGAVEAFPAWLVWLVLGRDVLILLMAIAGWLLFRFRDFPPSKYGKISTFLQMMAAGTALMAGAFPLPAFTALVTPFILGAAAGTILSGAHYVWLALSRVRARI
ncbi:MAG: CDP-alcohol phosphatidyltransferase family protein [Bryobacteraceae bacterium]|nr:CDP-alcohol phosphatidyltransferase family protein [Bryobacteraceae bacterium]